MLRTVVLISGQGSNLRAFLAACADGTVPASVVAVGADSDVVGLEHPRRAGIPTFVEPLVSFDDRSEWGTRLADAVDDFTPDLVVLSGFMRVLPPSFVHRFAPMVINTHPSFLPEFPGAHAVRDAIAAGVTETGASVIVVDDGVDTGPILAQERVPVRAGDTERILHERVKVVERALLAEVVRDLAARESTVLQEN